MIAKDEGGSSETHFKKKATAPNPTRAQSSFLTSFFSSGLILAGYQSKMYFMIPMNCWAKGDEGLVRRVGGERRDRSDDLGTEGGEVGWIGGGRERAAEKKIGSERSDKKVEKGWDERKKEAAYSLRRVRLDSENDLLLSSYMLTVLDLLIEVLFGVLLLGVL